MNFRTLALGCAAALALTTPALADNAGWYLGLGIGYDHLDEQVVKKSTFFPPVLGFVFHGGALGVVSGGYAFDDGLRLEGELSFVEHTAGQVDAPPRTFDLRPKNAGASNSSALFNAVYDIDVGNGLGAELGAGIGVADINEYVHGSNGVFRIASGARTAFEWQLIAGLTYQLDDNIVLFGDYRYRQAEVNQSYANTVGGPDGYRLGRNVEHVALLGLRWYLESAPPPPPAPSPPPAPTPAPPPEVKTIAIFFDFDKANLTAEAQERVTEAVKEVKAHGFVKVVITGHTDTVGSDSYNEALSVRRAQSVKDEMVRQGVDGTTISIEGKSFHDPLVSTAPGVREPQNRRAVIDLGG